MKRKILLFLSALLLMQVATKAQAPYGITIPSYIEPFPVEVTVNKTLNLLFHYRIKNVDIGSDAVIAQQINDTSLLVKAAREGFAETNLSVYTSDGKLHAFTVNYAATPKNLDILMGTGDPAIPCVAGGAGTSFTDDVLEHCSTQVAANARLRGHRRNKSYGVSVRLGGLYIRRDVLFFPLELRNRTNIGYDVGQLRFFIREKKRAKRTASQEIEIKPVYAFGNVATIPGAGRQTVVITLPKFTIPGKKYLRILLSEKEGGRTLRLDLHNRALVKAKNL